MGPKVQEFEELVAAACGVEHAVAVSNGTAALHLAVLALGIGEGDEVIVPAYTFPATASVVRLAGATPVLVDIDPATFNLDLGAGLRRGDAAHEGRARGSSLRPAARLGGAAERGAAGGAADRGRGRRARRALAWHALRRARNDGLPLVPSAKDRHDGRRRRGDDSGRRARRVDPAAAQPRARRRAPTSLEPVDELPARRHPLRDRDSAASPARRAARRPYARRGRATRERLARLRSTSRTPTRATRTAGRRT